MAEVEIKVTNDDGSQQIITSQLLAARWHFEHFHGITVALEIGSTFQQVDIPAPRPKRKWSTDMGLRKPQ